MKRLPLLCPLAAGLLVGHDVLAQYAEQPQQSPAAPGAYGVPPPAGQPQPATAPPGSQPPMEAGGLAPPPSTSPESPEVAQTEAKLDEAEQKDSGRGLEWVWLNAEIGFEHLGLQTFHANNLVDAAIVGTTQTGFLYGAGLGVRLVFITLGARFRMGMFSAYDLWTLDGEVGLRIPLGKLEPHLMIAAGFASLGAFSASDVGGGVNRDNLDISGYNVRAGGGLDYYVTPIFSVGAAVTFELLGLSRASVSDLQNLQSGGASTATAGELYQASGSSLGSALTGTLVLGLHF